LLLLRRLNIIVVMKKLWVFLLPIFSCSLGNDDEVLQRAFNDESLQEYSFILEDEIDGLQSNIDARKAALQLTKGSDIHLVTFRKLDSLYTLIRNEIEQARFKLCREQETYWLNEQAICKISETNNLRSKSHFNPELIGLKIDKFSLEVNDILFSLYEDAQSYLGDSISVPNEIELIIKTKIDQINKLSNSFKNFFQNENDFLVIDAFEFLTYSKIVAQLNYKRGHDCISKIVLIGISEPVLMVSHSIELEHSSYQKNQKIDARLNLNHSITPAIQYTKYKFDDREEWNINQFAAEPWIDTVWLETEVVGRHSVEVHQTTVSGILLGSTKGFRKYYYEYEVVEK
jgi:hypothetical protein